MRNNIGLIGKMGSGKDTAARALIHTYGYVPLSFAAPLKEMVIEADPLVSYRYHDQLGYHLPVPIHLSDIMAAGATFEECKREYPEVRRSLQRIGQGVRKLDDDYWVYRGLDAWYDVPAYSPVVFTDVRYPNEADMLRKNGFKLVRITRPVRANGMTTDETRAALHDSETALDGYPVHYSVVNDGDMARLHDQIVALV